MFMPRQRAYLQSTLAPAAPLELEVVDVEARDDVVPADQSLLEALRGGNNAAAAGLYTHNYAKALVVARKLAGMGAAEDLVQDAFMIVFASIKAGKGPDRHFRAYLLTTLRHQYQYNQEIAARLLSAGDYNDIEAYIPFGEHPAELLETSDDSALIMRALKTLPRPWQEVLWRTEVDGVGAATIAADLGVTTNSASALAYRARKGLTVAYLNGQVFAELSGECAVHAPHIPQLLRAELSGPRAAQLEIHLNRCTRCRRLADDIIDANSALLIPRERQAS
jgi:RNA polymerase sigma factor (sigma-70 family)